MLDLGCATAPAIGRDGLAAPGEGPARGQIGEIVPGGGAEDSLPSGHHKGSKRRGHEGVHGGILHQDQLSGVAMIITELLWPWRLTLDSLPKRGKNRETNLTMSH